MSRTLSLLVVSSAVTFAFAAPVPKGLKNQNRDKVEIVGEWLEPADKARIWWFKEDGTAGGGDLKDPKRKGQYRLDPSTDPKSLDWSDDGQTWQLGVYSIENDVLTVNIGQSARDLRPVSLDATPKSHRITATRKKDDR
jgi:uncharacterized protein (TIGR03067 family)